MSILVLHLTDAHVLSSETSFADRAQVIVAAALSPVMPISAVHIVLSGDMVQSGHADQYAIVNALVHRLRDSLSQRGISEVEVVTVAGNHDCDFSGDQSLRNLVLDAVSKRPAEVTEPIAAQMRIVLKNFDAHKSEVATKSEAVSPWVSFSTIDGETKLQYVMIDSSVMSHLPERQGGLFVGLPERDRIGLSADRVIYVMHHPLGWLAPDNARELAQFAAATGDIFLMGHEHVHWSERVSDLYENCTIHYLKGHTLKDSSNAANSAFQTIEICRDKGFLVRKYQFDGQRYSQVESQSNHEYVAWPTDSRVRGLAFSDGGYKTLADAGANFTHRRKAVITLPDIYIWPDLKPTSAIKDSGGMLVGGETVSAEDLLQKGADNSRVVIVKGGEQFGKSALARMLALAINKNDGYALVLSAGDISSWRERNLDERIDGAIDRLYGRAARESYRQLAPEKKRIIIDDFDFVDIARHGYEGLRSLRASFGTVYLLVDAYPGMEVALSEFLKDSDFVASEIYELQPLTYHQRLELIERWLSIGADVREDEHELRTLATRMGKVVDETLGRNFIPSVPLFVLVILQRAELEQDLNTVVKSGSHGFLYELLITQALSNGVRVCTLDTALTYLSSLAMKMYESGGDLLDENSFARFHLGHCEQFDLALSMKVMEHQLNRAEVLVVTEGVVSFKYPYHYYYFLARHFSTLSDWSVLEPHVKKLADALHTERAANVLLFLAHLGRNPSIAQYLLDKADSMLSHYEQANLFMEEGSIGSYSVPEIRQILLEGPRSVAVQNVKEDEEIAERAERDIDEAAKARLHARLDDALAMNAAFKTLQVLGQLLRNHAGSMPRDEKRNVAEACVALGLRTLGFLYNFIETHGEDVVSLRAAQLVKEFPKRSAEDIAEMLEGYIPNLAAGITVGTLIKIANAVGSEELSLTLASVLKDGSTRRLINLVTELEHFSDFPEDAVVEFKRASIRPADVLAFSVLRRFIIRRFQLFPVRRELKDAVRREFAISAKPFLLLEQKDKKGKSTA